MLTMRINDEMKTECQTDLFLIILFAALLCVIVFHTSRVNRLLKIFHLTKNTLHGNEKARLPTLFSPPNFTTQHSKFPYTIIFLLSEIMRNCQESRCAVATQLGVESMETTTTAIVLLFASTIYFDSCPLKTNTYITTTTKKKLWNSKASLQLNLV